MKKGLFIAVVILAAAGLAYADGEIVVKSAVTVDKERVTIGDVVSGGLPKNIASAFLIRTPAPGREGTVSGSFVAARIKQEGGKDLLVRAPEHITIRRASQTIAWNDIKSAAEASLRAEHSGEKVEITFPSEGRDLDAPAGPVSIAAVPAKRGPSLGRQFVSVEVRVADAFEKTVRVDACVDRPVKVVVAKHTIENGKTISEDDLEAKTVSARRAGGRTVRDVEDAVGRVARSAIAPGETLRPTTLKAAPIVRRGDIVTLSVETGTIEIMTYGVVQSEGHAGETVQVKNLDSGLMVRARIRDAHTALVEM